MSSIAPLPASVAELLAHKRYENFPVASRLLPARLRRPIASIYAFARVADDIADEPGLVDSARLAALDEFGARLDAIGCGEPPADALFAALAATMRAHALPAALLRDLLSAFRQDVTQRRYDNFAQVQDYCRRSANPIGRLLLALVNVSDPHAYFAADAACTAFQLINFLQDTQADYTVRGRIYLPCDEMARFGVTEADIAQQRHSDGVRQLFDLQIQRARDLLTHGAALKPYLPRRLGLEFALMRAGGAHVLAKLEAQNRTRFPGEARLGLGDWLRIAPRALFAA